MALYENIIMKKGTTEYCGINSVLYTKNNEEEHHDVISYLISLYFYRFKYDKDTSKYLLGYVNKYSAGDN